MGSGFKTFTAGSVLTASDVNNYLMEQSVMVFASTAARDSAITAPEAGMVAYINSNDASEGLWIYDGSTWRYAVPNSNTPLYAARAYGSTTTNIVAATWTTLANWTEDYDYNSNFNPTTGIYTVPVAGLYQISANASFSGNNNPQSVALAILKNDTTYMCITQSNDAGAAAGASYRLLVTDCIALAANDTVRIKVYNVGANTITMLTASDSSNFSIRKVPA